MARGVGRGDEIGIWQSMVDITIAIVMCVITTGSLMLSVVSHLVVVVINALLSQCC